MVSCQVECYRSADGHFKGGKKRGFYFIKRCCECKGSYTVLEWQKSLLGGFWKASF